MSEKCFFSLVAATHPLFFFYFTPPYLSHLPLPQRAHTFSLTLDLSSLSTVSLIFWLEGPTSTVHSTLISGRVDNSWSHCLEHPRGKRRIQKIQKLNKS